jgi:hypothetical protein
MGEALALLLVCVKVLIRSCCRTMKVESGFLAGPTFRHALGIARAANTLLSSPIMTSTQALHWLHSSPSEINQLLFNVALAPCNRDVALSPKACRKSQVAAVAS